MPDEAISRRAPKLVFFLAALLISLVVDQLTKYWIVNRFHYGQVVPVIPGLFDLTYVRNPGGAFSFFAGGAHGHRMVFFVGTTLLAIGLLIVFYRRLEPQARLAAVALGCVLGGAVGNLIDRLRYGEVVDFLDFYLWGGYTWPTFNMADSLIVVGVGILMSEILFDRDEREAG